MKKILVVVALLLGVSGSVFAQGLPLKDGNTGTLADIEACGAINCVQVNPPLVGTASGQVRQNYLRDAATSRENRITEEGESNTATGRLLFSEIFNGATVINTQFNQNLTTLASALTGGFLRLNSGLVTTANTGISFVSWRSFSREVGSAIKIKGRIRHGNGSVANKTFEFGLGYYDVAANQAAVMNEFVGFRWTSAGALVCVVDYSTGGAPTTVSANINGGVPFSDNVAREYEIIITENAVECWVNQVFQASVVVQSDASGITKGTGYPLIARLFFGTAPALVPTFDIGEVSVQRYGYEADVSVNTRQALMGRHSMQGQQGLTGTTGNTALIQASGTAPTGTTGSNTVATITGLGGYYRINGAAFGVAHSNIIVSSFQNPLFPEASGTATNGRNLVITDILISPMSVSTVLTGGPATWAWFVAVNGTALSLATADAVGGATIGTKAYRMLPLPIADAVVVTQAASTLVTRSGSSSISLQTPLVVHPGDFIEIGIRIISLTAITAGALDGVIGVSGFWD